MNSQTFNVLISSAGRRVSLLEIFRSTLADLGLRGKVLACDMSRLSSAFQSADRGFTVPRCTSPEFVPAVLDLCRRHDVRLVIPTIDPELHVYAQHRETFAAAGAMVAVSTPAVIDIGSDKQRTHQWLHEHGFPTVRQAAVEQVLRDSGDWEFPLLAKPVAGSASVGVAIVRDRAELVAATRGGTFIVQTLARGDEYTVDVFVNAAGRAVCAVPRHRLEVRAGEVSKGVVVRHAVLESLAKRVCEALPGARGAVNVQMFHDAMSGDIRVIEINPRFGGGFPLGWHAGALYPRWMIEEILGLPTTQTDDVCDGLVMLRYDHAVFIQRQHVEL